MQIAVGEQTITDKDNMILVHGFVIKARTFRKPQPKVTIRKGSVWITDPKTGRCLEIELPV